MGNQFSEWCRRGRRNAISIDKLFEFDSSRKRVNVIVIPLKSLKVGLNKILPNTSRTVPRYCAWRV